jgi:hypothetical protein
MKAESVESLEGKQLKMRPRGFVLSLIVSSMRASLQFYPSNVTGLKPFTTETQRPRREHRELRNDE